ncbi:MAG TPA: hypothetical protein VI669_17970 [Vicinamibacteria bacterium]
MTPSAAAESSNTPAADIDANGVDRAQIRVMLDLTPEQRLRKVQDFVRVLVDIRDRNAEHPIR